MKNRLFLLFATVAAALALSGCGYNRFQSLDEQTKSAWSEVLNQYQRRADLVPNIVASVKGQANFEQETLTKVIEARARHLDPGLPRTGQQSGGAEKIPVGPRRTFRCSFTSDGSG